jgi:preprotein translocase SecE subunit
VARNRKRARDRRPRGPKDAAGLVTAGDGAPEPLEHAAPDVELADAQLALGRPELAEDGGAGTGEDGGGDSGNGDGGELTPAPGGPPAPRQSIGGRLVNFLRGSWRELQRVQWPDRRQVMQATGVVIGFVIVAGAYLGVADFVAQKLVNFVLK